MDITTRLNDSGAYRLYTYYLHVLGPADWSAKSGSSNVHHQLDSDNRQANSHMATLNLAAAAAATAANTGGIFSNPPDFISSVSSCSHQKECFNDLSNYLYYYYYDYQYSCGSKCLGVIVFILTG